MDLEERVSRRV